MQIAIISASGFHSMPNVITFLHVGVVVCAWICTALGPHGHV
jgi:hypothetical protein